MLVSEQNLTRYGRALTGVSFGVPLGITRWRPAPSVERDLRQLHRAAIQMAKARLSVLADAAAAHGLEQQLLHGLIDCMGGGPIYREPPAARRRRDVLARFEAVLQTDVLQRSAEICAVLGVSGRLLRECCKEHLGIALNHYARLYRMQQVHGTLRGGNVKSTKIAEVAERHGFRDPGRFASNYRGVYGELPSATLRRRSLEAR
jgi:AraC family ethanolamine operon transcriptional activator